MKSRLVWGWVMVVWLWLGGGFNSCTAADAVAAADTVNPVIEVSSVWDEIKVSVNGTPIDFPDQSPYLSNNRTMVPLRFISEALGAEVNWDETSRQVVVKGDQMIELSLDSNQATIDGMAFLLDAPPEVAGQRAMVPLRFVSEALGAEVKYLPPANLSANPPDWKIDVSVGEQKVRVYDGDTLVKDWTASTGANNSTPTGTFLLQNRGEWFFSSKYQQGAQYWVSFKDWGTYLFHSVPMDRQGTVIDEEAAKLGTPASHGCVRLATEDAQWLYRNIPTGTPVSIRA